MGSRNEQILVAMSGGVDSSAAACLLAEQGYSVVGVSMQVWDYRKHLSSDAMNSKVTCCAPSDFDDARRIACAKGFPYYVYDFEVAFYDDVIRPFINAYLKGLTPNPCLECNRKVKFSKLREAGKRLGIDLIATGHYAQIIKKSDHTFGLFTGRDETKDQSYFLYAMTQQDLAHTCFPVGAMEKSEVRSYLRKQGFEIADKSESQDICFVSGSVGDFIEREAGIKPCPGKIVSTDGKVVGEHNGVYQYTVGQRKGLKIAYSEPLYVTEIRPEDNQVVVGTKDQLERKGLVVKNLTWCSDKPAPDKFRALCKLRYRHPGVVCEIEKISQEAVSLRFVDSWSTVSPGQAAVFYALENNEHGREVIGGGIISKESL